MLVLEQISQCWKKMQKVKIQIQQMEISFDEKKSSQ